MNFSGGLSGAKLDVLPNGVLRKYGDSRLIKQAGKQRLFENNGIIDVPKVFNIGQNYFDMEYVRNIGVIDFLNRAGKRHLNLLLSILFLFIQRNIQVDVPERDHRQEIVVKCNSLGIDLDTPDEVMLPNGSNHGDFTLGNILYSFSLEKFYLVDFLDCYIDSPIMDLIKLRQSTHLYWELFLYGELNNIRAKIALDYLDAKILEFYDIPHYNLLQKINLHRIIPYCRTQEEKDFIYKQLSEIG